MSDQKCQACNWCFPFCCCTGPQLHIPLAVLAVLSFLGGIGTLDDLISSSNSDGETIYSYAGSGFDFLVWALAIINVIAPLVFIVSLFSALDGNVRRICVFIFFVYLCIDAVCIGILFIFLAYISIVFDAANCSDAQDVCDAFATVFWILTVTCGLILLMNINWAMATWYHYSNNLDDSNRAVQSNTNI